MMGLSSPLPRPSLACATFNILMTGWLCLQGAETSARTAPPPRGRGQAGQRLKAEAGSGIRDILQPPRGFSQEHKGKGESRERACGPELGQRHEGSATATARGSVIKCLWQREDTCNTARLASPPPHPLYFQAEGTPNIRTEIGGQKPLGRRGVRLRRRQSAGCTEAPAEPLALACRALPELSRQGLPCAKLFHRDLPDRCTILCKKHSFEFG